jgi:hypothetical protein
MDRKSVLVTQPAMNVQYVEPDENRKFWRHLLRKRSNFHIGTCGYIDVNSDSNLCIFSLSIVYHIVIIVCYVSNLTFNMVLLETGSVNFLLAVAVMKTRQR